LVMLVGFGAKGTTFAGGAGRDILFVLIRESSCTV
jgi:hypothetical protein